MTLHLDCAACQRYACRVGRLDATPDDCPMRGPFPSYEELYAAEEARTLLYHSARVEAEGYGRWTRVHEVAELSRRLGLERLGVVCCPDMEREAGLAADALRSEGLSVTVAGPGPDCDPAGSAEILRRATPPCRVEEVMSFARRAGVAHLGIVFCVGFRREAEDLEAILGTNGFRVSSSCCKTGSVPKEEIGIRDEEKVRPGQPEMTCNPAAQAALLDEAGVELMVLLGQCVGHDSATMARARAPVVCLVAKDRVLAHNTVAALYRA